ncbi:catechol 2,3-dioxygenase [Planococcus sp. APC 3900]|uniref:catechol 2,3-dioxygenase n=1 Tax=Planococcus sp. APC 3900 TaxID=3035191 RepID=UPI0025B2DC10|nr:catechol 2,3-dioxygenase [Planococcus sp. APC 3900]MDN3438483.1 catechol 2,3-dioxygenase [Planococcus sp. APC 3900]
MTSELTNQFKEPIFDVAQIAHVEVLSPTPKETVAFYTDMLGMEIVDQVDQKTYLRAYEDNYKYSLIVTEGEEAGLGHVAWRTTSPQALERRVKALEESGQGIGWANEEYGHGPAYQFTTPDGHKMEVFWEVEYYDCHEDKHSKLMSRSQKRPKHGVPVRRLDHINLMSSNPAADTNFMVETLGFKVREQIVDNDHVIGTWNSVSNLVHEIAFMQEPTGAKGKLHHVCYWYGIPQNLYDVADLLKDHDYFIEIPPNKHGVSQAFCMYVYEPSGNRVELFGDAGYLIFDPDWKTLTWEMEDVPGNGDTWIGAVFPDSFWNYGTPAPATVPVKVAAE